jgi:hypothetical protein
MWDYLIQSYFPGENEKNQNVMDFQVTKTTVLTPFLMAYLLGTFLIFWLYISLVGEMKNMKLTWQDSGRIKWKRQLIYLAYSLRHSS